MFEMFKRIQYHNCVSRKEGEWIIFHCPICKCDVRKQSTSGDQQQNLFTGDINIMHQGIHQTL